MEPLLDEYGNPIVDLNNPANDPMSGLVNYIDEPLPDIDPSLFDDSGEYYPPLGDVGQEPRTPSPLESLPETGLRFDPSVLAVQTEEEFDALAPELQEALEMIDSGVEFSERGLAEFVMKRREALQKAQSPEAQFAKLKAEAGIERIPPGYDLQRDESGAPKLRVTPGGPVARQRIVYNNSVKTASGTVIEDVQKAMSLLETAGRRAAGFGGMLSNIPESDARQLKAYVSSIQGNVGVDQLIKIKQTGAGLGQVPQSQLDLLSRLLGNLDQMQKPAELMDVFKRIDRIYENVVQMADKEIRELSGETEAGDSAPAAAAPTPRQTKTVAGQTYEKQEDGKWHLLE